MFFRPRLFDSFSGYSRALFTKDVFAGLTVGIVALPLAMAFAIASGLKPQAGIFTAIIAGGLISLLGGSRVQIGGPAGAFIVIVYGIVERYGVPNLYQWHCLFDWTISSQRFLRTSNRKNAGSIFSISACALLSSGHL